MKKQKNMAQRNMILCTAAFTVENHAI